jgi:CheY-like chemotaxis protein
VRAPGRDNTEIPLALMERSHLTAVIVGSMQPHAIDDMLTSLRQAASEPNWRCPALLFMLPPSAVWIANRIASIAWPEQLQIQVQNESLSSASAVWNSVLSVWDRVKGLSRWSSATPDPEPAQPDFPIKVADLEHLEGPDRASGANSSGFGREAAERSGAQASTSAPSVYVTDADPVLRPTNVLDPLRAQQALSRLLATEGVLACALVDGISGLSIAREVRPDQRFDIDTAIAASAQVMRAHRLAARSAGFSDPIDEVIVSAGSTQQLIHRVVRHQDLFLFAQLDKNLINLALARLKVLETEKGLA